MACINIICILANLLAMTCVPVFGSERYAIFSQTTNTRIANATKTYSAISGISCCRICMRFGECGIASYNLGSRICEILELSPGNLENSVPEHGWTVYVRSAPVCPEGWTPYSFSCYFLDVQLRTHADATAFCESQAAHLADITTEEENGFVVNLLTQTLQDTGKADNDSVYSGDIMVLLGATNSGGKSDYYWTDGTLVSAGYMNWGQGEPNNLGEDCLAASGATGFRWADLDCSRAEMSLCEK